ncbi:hypothetical protein BCR37DRAFT_388538 [Protomyces lactucae-debilis]|uniref:Uncharacterized protein n=1 Tax=Protomyces lactucae-debilis TaxID=2754530 RepID=A0A1Y2F844_PROLT|nr:uncharacterized protein BCR37DRAFT_388538 [Protomyces lactucae-debilis]ORY79536.1 hypothetical protein BCR37DRAFT_388538 [Protomyces lactucae-debilis]
MPRVVIRRSMQKEDFDYIDLDEPHAEPASRPNSRKAKRRAIEDSQPSDENDSVASAEAESIEELGDEEYVLDEGSSQVSGAPAAEDGTFSPEVDRKLTLQEPLFIESSPEEKPPKHEFASVVASPEPDFPVTEEDAIDDVSQTPVPEDEEVIWPPIESGEQLGWIMEHLAKTGTNFPDDAFNDLVSLVCDDEEQPKQVPCYLLAKALTRSFRSDIRLCDWAAATTALQQLDQVEKRLRNHFAAMEGHAMKKYLYKERKALTNMFRYVYIGLRRWAVIHEAMQRKTTNGRLLTLINVLFPAQLPAHNMAAQRGMAEQMGNHRGALLRFVSGLQQYRDEGVGRLPVDYPGYSRFATQLSWSSVHTVLVKYLTLVQQAMAKVEHFLEPIPEPLQAMGIKRSDTVMNRIARHLIGTCKHGYDTTLREADALEALRSRLKEERRLLRQKMREAKNSGEVPLFRTGLSPEL